MRRTWARFRQWLPASAAVLSAVLAGLTLPADTYADVTQELIAFFGLLMAAVLPAMTLTATALRAGNLSRLRLSKLHLALRQQLNVWFGMFVLSMSFCAAVVLGKMLDWHISVPLPFEILPIVDLSGLLVGAITGGVVLLAMRVGAVGRGILSILDLSREIAMSEAAESEAGRMKRVADAAAQVTGNEGRGSFVELPEGGLEPRR